MPNALRINVSGNNTTSGVQQLLDHVRSVSPNARHITQSIDSTLPAPQFQVTWPDPDNYQYMLLVIGVPGANGGEFILAQNGFNTIFTIDLPDTTGDVTLALIPKQNVSLLPPLLDFTADVDIDVIDIYFL